MAKVDGMTVSVPGGTPLVGVIMGSKTDWETMKHAVIMLRRFGICCEYGVKSAHRTPDDLFEYAATARERGIKVIIGGAGGAAHLPGMAAAKTHLPVIGVPMKSEALSGVDSTHSIQQMPKGTPVATMAIGKAGAINAAILAVQVIALMSGQDHYYKLDNLRKEAATEARLSQLKFEEGDFQPGL